jgi:hypothetical protein
MRNAVYLGGQVSQIPLGPVVLSLFQQICSRKEKDVERWIHRDYTLHSNEKHGCVRSYHLRPTYNLILEYVRTSVEKIRKVAFESHTYTTQTKRN